MVRSTDRPAMTIAVDLGRKATKTNKLKPLEHCCKMFYVSIYIALCSTESQLKVLERNIFRHKTLRMIKFHPITAFMTTYGNFEKIFLIRAF